jgi:hypothetical protein
VRLIIPYVFDTNKRSVAEELASVSALKLRGISTERGVPGGRKKPVKMVRLEPETLCLVVRVVAAVILSPK